MLEILFTVAPWAGVFVAGALVNGKLVIPALHKRPAGPIRDALLRLSNGGPGSLPR